MRNLVVIGMAALALAGCASKRGRFTTGPDEFAVARAAPLVIPPDFALVPPKPGEPRAVEGDSSRQALQALFGGPAQRSAAETQALGAAGTNRAAAGIRSNVGDPNTKVVDKAGVTRDIIAAPEGDGQDARAAIPGATPAPAAAAPVQQPPK